MSTRLTKQGILRPSQLVFWSDQIIQCLAFFAAAILQFRVRSLLDFPVQDFTVRLTIHLSAALIVWYVFRLNRRVIRFFQSRDYLSLIVIIGLGHALSYGVGVSVSPNPQLEYVVYLASYLIAYFLISSSRLLITVLYGRFRNGRSATYPNRLLIYGAGELGILFRQVLSTARQDFLVVGFLDDDPTKIGRVIDGVRVFSASDNLEDTIALNGITDVVIAINGLGPARKSSFLEKTLPFSIRIREIRSFERLFQPGFSMEQLNQIEIGDLMNRAAIQLGNPEVARNVKGKRVLVTGAAGSIGSEIVRQLTELDPAQVICVDFSESALYDLQQSLVRKGTADRCVFELLDIRDVLKVHRVLAKSQPNWIFHAAAYKHVPMLEEHPWMAVENNIIATYELAKLAQKFRVERFVQISTDKAVDPSSVMGATKRFAELMVTSLARRSSTTCFVITRFGNVLGSNGSVVPLFRQQIQEGGPVTVTHPEITRYFMTITEACELVLEAAVMASGSEIFVFDMGTPVRILDLAKNMIRLAGLTPNVDIPILFTGLRPGEKIHEVLFDKEENLQQTYHEKIMISTDSRSIQFDVESLISALKRLATAEDPSACRIALFGLLPKSGDKTENSPLLPTTLSYQ